MDNKKQLLEKDIIEKAYQEWKNSLSSNLSEIGRDMKKRFEILHNAANSVSTETIEGMKKGNSDLLKGSFFESLLYIKMSKCK